jgi:hypothetical protein
MNVSSSRTIDGKAVGSVSPPPRPITITAASLLCFIKMGAQKTQNFSSGMNRRKI